MSVLSCTSIRPSCCCRESPIIAAPRCFVCSLDTLPVLFRPVHAPQYICTLVDRITAQVQRQRSEVSRFYGESESGLIFLHTAVGLLATGKQGRAEGERDQENGESERARRRGEGGAFLLHMYLQGARELVRMV